MVTPVGLAKKIKNINESTGARSRRQQSKYMPGAARFYPSFFSEIQ
jgi:hypothetical protein